MNKNKFTDLILNPDLLDAGTLPILEKVMVEFPYCQALEILYLINLKKENDHRYDRQLKLAAAYASDRSKLMDWMLKTKPVRSSPRQSDRGKAQYIVLPELQPVNEQGNENARHLIDGELKSHLDELESLIRSNLAEIEEKRAKLRQLIGEKQSILHDSEYNPEVTIPEEKKEARPLPKDELLEEFIRQHKGEVIQQPDFFNPVETAKKSVEDKEDIVSETLARVLASQGNVVKAIKIYQQLILKYPEKSRYFAAQIEKLNERFTNKG